MTTENQVPDSLIEKIQKLLALKNDKAASQGEIENASAMVTALLMKYNLSMGQVENHKSKDANKPLGDTRWNLNGRTNRHESDWLRNLFFTIAQYNMCKALYRPGARFNKDDMGEMIIIGTDYNIEIVQYLMDQLVERIKPMEAGAWRIYSGIEKRNAFRRGYLRGVAEGIRIKLQEQESQRIAAATMGNQEAAQVGLMVVSNKDKLALYIQEKFRVRNGGTQSGLSASDGHGMGKEAGRGMNIHGGLGSGQRRLN